MADINQTAPWVTARLTELGNATNDGLNTIVTSANIGAYDAGNVSGVVAIEHGGTGANNAADAITNLGALTTSDVSTVGKTGEYADLLNKPTIPTISQTYNASSADGMSGAAVAQGIAAETSRATTAEGNLNTAINTEKTRAQNAESALNTAITNEVNRAQGVEATLTTSVGHLADNFADAYSASSTYYKGDYVIHDNVLYVANQNITTAEAWNAAHWDAVSVSDITIETAEENAKSFPQKTASGDAITITDGADGIPIKDMTVNITAVQSGSGDPSPTNVRAISGWDACNITVNSKNLVDPNAVLSYSGIDQDTGEFNTTTTYACSNYLDVSGMGSVMVRYYKKSSGGQYFRIARYDANKALIDFDIKTTQSGTGEKTHVTDTSQCVYIAVMIGMANIDSLIVAETWDRYTIQLGQTVYGGTLNPLTGEMTVTHVVADLGNFTWTYVSNGAYFRTVVSNTVAPVNLGVTDAICSCYKRYNGGYSGFTGPDKAFYLSSANITSQSKYLCIRDTDYSDADLFDTAVTGQTLVYPLATPFTVQLSPTQIATLLGQNNVWCDTGDIEVTYRADPAMYTAEAVEETYESLLPAFPTSTVDGAVASFPDGADNIPMKSVIAHIEPVQAGSGDPSPENVRAISGWDTATVMRTGKNMFDQSLFLEATGWTFDGEYYTGVSGQLRNKYPNHLPNIYNPKGLPQLTISFDAYSEDAVNSLYFRWYYSDGTTVNTTPIAGTELTHYANSSNPSKTLIRVFPYYANTRTVHIKNFQIEVGSTATAYEPYTGQTYPINFDSAGTVYGGYADVVKGELVVTHKKRAISEGGWTHNTQYDFYYTNTIMDRKMGSPVLASCYNYVGIRGDSAMNSLETGSIAIGSSSTRTVKIKDTRYTTTADFSESDGYFIYELETPIEVQLTPAQITTLLGQNNVWCDTGDIEVTYRADPALYIDRKINATKSMIAGVETEMVATQNYTIGQYLIVGDNLYKVTAAIATGTAITVGTNVVATTVAEQLIALATA